MLGARSWWEMWLQIPPAGVCPVFSPSRRARGQSRGFTFGRGPAYLSPRVGHALGVKSKNGHQALGPREMFLFFS